MASIKDLVLRVERYLKYQMYHAKNTYPYPEDQNVAEWVREEGEPNGWTRFSQDGAVPDEPVAPAPAHVSPAPLPKEEAAPAKPAKHVVKKARVI